MSPFWTYGDLVFMAILYLPLSAAGTILLRHRAGGLLAGQLIGYVAWFLVLALLFRIKYGRPFWSSLGWTKAPHWFSRSFVIGMALMLGIAAASHWMRLPDVDSPVKKLLDDSRTLPLAAFSIVVAGPLAEELAFRGFAQPLLAKSWGTLAGILLTALPFGLLHAPQLENSWKNVALIVMAGAVFGGIRHLSRSTLASTVAHATYNGALLAGFLISKIHG